MTRGRTRRSPRSIFANDSGSEEERATGGASPGATDPERARSTHSSGWRRYMDTCNGHRGSPQTETHGVMNRLRCGRSSDFEWLESAHRWTGTTCRAASLDCSGWSEERDAGGGRLDRVEGGDLRRTGPSRTTIQDVPLGVGNGTFVGNGTIEIATIRYSPL